MTGRHTIRHSKSKYDKIINVQFSIFYSHEPPPKTICRLVNVYQFIIKFSKICLKLINAFAHKLAFCICQKHDSMSSKEHLRIAYQVFMQYYAGFPSVTTFSFYFIKQYSMKVKWINSMTEWKKKQKIKSRFMTIQQKWWF